ncbi:MAG: hypothetical protein Cons2KO_25660 [Congregibacter sp.]
MTFTGVAADGESVGGLSLELSPELSLDGVSVMVVYPQNSILLDCSALGVAIPRRKRELTSVLIDNQKSKNRIT